jgi:hypothetical protein
MRKIALCASLLCGDAYVMTTHPIHHSLTFARSRHVLTASSSMGDKMEDQSDQEAAAAAASLESSAHTGRSPVESNYVHGEPASPTGGVSRSVDEGEWSERRGDQEEEVADLLDSSPPPPHSAAAAAAAAAEDAATAEGPPEATTISEMPASWAREALSPQEGGEETTTATTSSSSSSPSASQSSSSSSSFPFGPLPDEEKRQRKAEAKERVAKALEEARLQSPSVQGEQDMKLVLKVHANFHRAINGRNIQVLALALAVAVIVGHRGRRLFLLSYCC